MADIKIDNLQPAGSDFFGDSESYMSELTEDTIDVWGGTGGGGGGLTSAVSGNLTGALTSAIPTVSAASAISAVSGISVQVLRLVFVSGVAG